MDSYWGAYMSEAKDNTTVLPLSEQVSRGQELLNMLGVNSGPADLLVADQVKLLGSKAANVDLTVVVKNSFIEVVAHPAKQRLTRSLSDSMLIDFKSDLEQPWTSEKPWKQNLVDKFADLSDASTNVSLEAEDCTLWSGTEATQSANFWCTLEYDKDVAQTLHPPQQYGCVESWWMPHFDENLIQFSQGMQDQAAISDTAFGPCAWAEEQRFSQDQSSGAHLMSEEWRTTVMVRNMPNNYTRKMLLDLLESIGFAPESYDFIYLPVDFKSQAGLGYAFVNFVSSAEALRCFDLLEGFSDWKVPSEKVCTVMWGSPYQGLEAHIERYRSSPVMHHSIPEDWKPMIFQRGVRVSFPSPDKPIKTPKIRKH